MQRWVKVAFIGCLLWWGLAIGLNLNSPLEGLHSIRQADTIFQSYFFCSESADFLRPRIAQRGNGSGIVAGEVPFFSYFVALPCFVTQTWWEAWPRVAAFLWCLLALVGWGLFLRQKYKIFVKEDFWITWFLLFGFSTFVLTHWMIPMPDVMAVALMGWGLWIFEKGKLVSGAKFIISFCAALVLWIMGFSMRPYLFPLILLSESKALMAAAFLSSLLVYQVWYRTWAPMVSERSYYAITAGGPQEFLAFFKDIMWALGERLFRNHLHGVGLILIGALTYGKTFFTVELSLEQKKIFRKYLWFCLLSIAFVLFFRARHVINHGYYLGAAGVGILILLWMSLQTLSVKHRTWFLLAYSCIGIINTQHLFRQKEKQQMQALLEIKKSQNWDPHQKVVIYSKDGRDSPTELFFLKMTGWALDINDFRGPQSCPQGAHYYLLMAEDSPHGGVCTLTDSP